ncbi:MAG: glycosyltransferase family 39 protein [Acidobacteriota bacterium]|nr:glycosyltransferase family 39 protein [Acidobacteriota bacterium]
MNPSHSRRGPFGVSALSAASILVLVVGCVLYSFSLGSLSRVSADEALFAYPALKASLGGSFTYALSAAAPYGDQVWAYHGPVLPYLDEILFRLFGFSSMVARLPDFLGGWLAALLLVLSLNRKGYRYAGLAFAILWCGDRSMQELVLGRMDGLALLSVVVSFLFLERASTQRDRSSALLCGLFCGLSILIHPLCIFFALLEFTLISFRHRRDALPFVLGAGMCIPALLAFWHFRVHQSLAQFLWQSRIARYHSGMKALFSFLSNLHWNKAWVLSLMLFIIVSAVLALVLLLRSRGKTLEPSDSYFVLAAAMGLAGLAVFSASAMFTYYLVYLTVWPILCAVILAEKHWSRFRPAAIVLAVVWVPSASGNLVRLLKPIWYHHALSSDFLYSKVRELVPVDATIAATPRLYDVPIGAGFSKFGLTKWYKEFDDVCPSCYLLMTDNEFKVATFVPRSNLDQRKILYAGAAYPKAGELVYPIVLLSPEKAADGIYRTDGPGPN